MFEQLSKKEQLIYLSGLFEGEGWFGINKRKEGWTPSAVMEVQMTDEDIITKFKDYLTFSSKLHIFLSQSIINIIKMCIDFLSKGTVLYTLWRRCYPI